MRSWSLIHASGRQSAHFATRLQARAELVRSGDAGAFVAALDSEDHAVLSAEGPRELALRLLSDAAAVACPEHDAGPGVPCAPGPARICPRRMETAGFIPYVNGRNGARAPGDVLAGRNYRPSPAGPLAGRVAPQLPIGDPT